jgi:hypothetical protein
LVIEQRTGLLLGYNQFDMDSCYTKQIQPRPIMLNKAAQNLAAVAIQVLPSLP